MRNNIIEVVTSRIDKTKSDIEVLKRLLKSDKQMLHNECVARASRVGKKIKSNQSTFLEDLIKICKSCKERVHLEAVNIHDTGFYLRFRDECYGAAFQFSYHDEYVTREGCDNDGGIFEDYHLVERLVNQLIDKYDSKSN